VQAWIEGGQVTVNGALVRRVSARAALGDRLSVVLPEPKPRRRMAAEDQPLDVLYEDDCLMAIDKPAGVVVHPAYGHPTGTLMNALVGRSRLWPAGQRPSIVGRLDKGTSGIVLVAKTAAIHSALQRASEGREEGRPVRGRPVKEYLAIVHGRPPARGRIDLGLRLDPRDRRRVVVSQTAGAHSITEFERLARGAAFETPAALLLCRLVTGRRHQIRVHLAARGWPIVGDAKYGGGAAFSRPALHAWRLRIAHPITGEALRIEAPIPSDMVNLAARAGLILPA
jgi:23S rRNA pseudouridine1911/1915/1917 synthase